MIKNINNSQLKILIIDDIPENLEVAGSILSKEGYDISVADHGVFALELLENTCFDLILLDINMPGLDGFETCRRIKQKREYQNTPVILLSGMMGIENLVKGFECGAIDFISKPFNPIELIARVRNFILLKITADELERKNIMLEEVNRKLEILSVQDELTQLMNRRAIRDVLEKECVRIERYGLKFSIIFIDIDHFKRINDQYGHDCGDFILKELSGLLTGNVRKQDFVARWGGEELLIVLPETSGEAANFLAERLRQKIEENHFTYEDQDIRLTITAGIAEYARGSNLESLLIQADKAMYIGKSKGRNCVIYW